MCFWLLFKWISWPQMTRTGNSCAVSLTCLAKRVIFLPYLLPQPFMKPDNKNVPVLQYHRVPASAACLPLSQSLGEKRRNHEHSFNQETLPFCMPASLWAARKAYASHVYILNRVDSMISKWKATLGCHDSRWPEPSPNFPTRWIGLVLLASDCMLMLTGF
jgi:hypothetical protein